MSDRKKWETPAGLQLEALWGLDSDGGASYEYRLWQEDYSGFVTLGQKEFEALRAISEQWQF